jgi:hypothetical protein
MLGGRRLGGSGVLERAELGGDDRGERMVGRVVDALERGEEGALVQPKEPKVESRDATNREALRGRPRRVSCLGAKALSEPQHSPCGSARTSGAASRFGLSSTEGTVELPDKLLSATDCVRTSELLPVSDANSDCKFISSWFPL